METDASKASLNPCPGRREARRPLRAGAEPGAVLLQSEAAVLAGVLGQLRPQGLPADLGVPSPPTSRHPTPSCQGPLSWQHLALSAPFLGRVQPPHLDVGTSSPVDIPAPEAPLPRVPRAWACLQAVQSPLAARCWTVLLLPWAGVPSSREPTGSSAGARALDGFLGLSPRCRV